MTRDLMFGDDVRRLVADSYDELDEPTGPATRLYTGAQLAAVPDGARRWALGVGNPLVRAGLRPGEKVADLGCGAGIDTVLAAKEVGPGGEVIGVDMLAGMVDRARRFAAEAGLANVTLHQAEMEQLPLPDDSVDVVISNGAINLVARKSRVLAEAFRILRPGGRMVVADLTIDEDELPTRILTHPSAWAG